MRLSTNLTRPIGVGKVTTGCCKIDVSVNLLSKKYALINVFEELSSDKVTIIVFHGYREVVSPGAEAVTVASFVR